MSETITEAVKSKYGSVATSTGIEVPRCLDHRFASRLGERWTTRGRGATITERPDDRSGRTRCDPGDEGLAQTYPRTGVPTMPDRADGDPPRRSRTALKIEGSSSVSGRSRAKVRVGWLVCFGHALNPSARQRKRNN
jgi:hypothetical protein